MRNPFRGKAGRPRKRASLLKIGMAFIVVALLGGIALFNKDAIRTTFMPGTTIELNFERKTPLRDDVTDVKISGVPVGTVTGVEQREDGTATVWAKVDHDVPEKLRTAPSAKLRPATLLGGKYFVDLVPGGQPGEFNGVIPARRTTVPVEVDEVLRTLQKDKLAAAQSSIRQLNRSLDHRGRSAIDRLLADAPEALKPATEVLRAAQGNRPGKDLRQVVSGLEATARTLKEKPGQLDSIVRNTESVTSVLGNRSEELAATMNRLPRTLDSANSGLRNLRTTLHKLRDTADPAKPVATELDTALEHMAPVLDKARPLVRDAKDLLADARPVVRELVPASRQLTATLRDVQGPVLQRANGPIKKTVLAPSYQGKGPYAQTSGDRPLYKELGYMLANVDRASAMTDGNGASISFQPGVAPGSVGGLPISLQQLYRNLTNIDEQEGR